MNKNLIILAAIVVAIIGGVYYFLPGGKLTAKDNNGALTLPAQNNQNLVMFSVDAKRWQFTPDIIRVKKGQRVKIIVNNTDTTHGINIPDFNASGNDSVEFTADKTGEFTFYCNNFCGEGHGTMRGKIVIN